MTVRSIAILAALAVACAAVPRVNAQVPPPPIVRVLGGGEAVNDCFVTYDITGVLGQAPTLSCTDGASCDGDGLENGSCRFDVKVCVDTPQQAGCTPSPVTKLKGSKLLPNLPTLGGTAEACSAVANQVVVKLKKKGKKPGKKSIKMSATADAGKDKDKFKLVCNPPQKVCLNGGPGARAFTLLYGPNDPLGSHFFSSALPGAPVESAFDGSICLRSGTPGADGVATLEVFETSYLHFNDLGGGSDCIEIQATGSQGKLDCDGGTAVGTTAMQDSGGVGANGPNGPVTSTYEEGAPGQPGDGYVRVNVRAVTCGGVLPELPGACITGLPASAADCADPTKIDFSKGFVFEALALTTGQVTSKMTNTRQGPEQMVTRTGQPFDCSSFESSDSAGILVLALPLPDVDFVNGDTANVAQFDD